MNSQTLKENGFTGFLPLKELSLLNLSSNGGHVLVLIDETLSGKPTSDILYIGRAKKPVKKIFGGYLGGSGGKTVQKIHSALFSGGYIEKAAISLKASDDPKAAQEELLEKFREEHGEYPSWNNSKKETKRPRSQQKSAETLRTQKSAVQKAKKLQ